MEHEKTFRTLNEAREHARKMSGIGEEAVDFIQEIGPSKGRVSGRMSQDGKQGWRLDYDDKKAITLIGGINGVVQNVKTDYLAKTK